MIEVVSHRGFTISVRPEQNGSVATIAGETGQPIVLNGELHQTIALPAAANNEAAMHDATILIDRILRGWHRKSEV